MRRFVELLAVVVVIAAALPALGQNRPLLAVMDIQDRTGALSADVIDNLTEYLRGLLAESGKYTVIDRSRQAKAIKDVLQKERKETHKACYERSCQVPVGRILAADQVLLTTLMKVGSQFMLKAEILRLDTEASTGGATARGEFAPKQGLEDRVIEALDTVAGKIAGQAGSSEPASRTVATEEGHPATTSDRSETTPMPKPGWQSASDKLGDKANRLQIRAKQQKKALGTLKALSENERLPLKERLAAIDDFSASLEPDSSYKEDARRLRAYTERGPEYYRTKTEWFGLQLTAGAMSGGFIWGLDVAAFTFRWHKFHMTLLQFGFRTSPGGPDYPAGAYGVPSSFGVAFGVPLHRGAGGRTEFRAESDVDFLAHAACGIDDCTHWAGFGLTPRVLFVYHVSPRFSLVGGLEVVVPVVAFEGSKRPFAGSALFGFRR